jgi:phage terminase large subunit-like protein
MRQTIAKKAPAKKPARTATPKRPTRNRSPWASADLVALKISPEVAWYMEDRGFPVPDCPPLWKTPEPRRVRGARFDAERVDHVIASFRQLRHTKGRFAGQVFEPDAWQIAYVLAPWAGWVIRSPDSGEFVRIITTLYVELPRKNGKTTLAGGIALYMVGADGEHGAQVLTAATTKDQANLCFDPMRQLVLRSGLRAYLKPFKAKIVHSASGSYFQSIAHAGDAQHGADIHCGIVDELHLHKEMSLIDALETGTGSRTQPLILLITTADAGKRHTPYDGKRSRIEKLARGVLKDPTTYGVIFAAEKAEYENGKLVGGDDPFVVKTWRKANPGFGISPTIRFMTDEAAKAKESPAELARFLRLHLGIRTKQESRYLDVDDWDLNAGIVVPQRLKGKLCYGGLDLGSTSDLTALVWVFPDKAAGGFDVLARFWTPEDALEALDDRTAKAASTEWVSQGWLRTTPGNVTDYDYIKTQVDADLEAFEVGELAYDPWNAQQLVNDLINDGAPMVKMRQGFVSMSAPTKDLQRFLGLGAAVDKNGAPVKPMVRHGGNPVLRWMVDGFAVAMDPSGNVKPDKANAGDKIDGVVALIMGLGRATANADTDEVWGMWM